MKKMLIMVALMGFIATGSYAQNTKNCPCKKTVQHKVAVTHTKTCPSDIAVHRRVTHTVYRETNKPDNVNYMMESTYLGNYPQYTPELPENNVYLEPPFVPYRPQVVPFVSGPSDDRDYYLNLLPDGSCRWHCSLSH